MSASQRPVVLITGAARRIGAAIARGLHDAGYDIALHYRNSGDAATALRDELERARKTSVQLLQADLADITSLPVLVDRVIERFGRLDGLVNNASAFHPTPIGTITENDWDTLFAGNAKAPLFLSQAVAPHLRASAGAIVNIVDIYAERPLRDHALYAMSKAALSAMTRALAVDLAPSVRVNAIAPGAMLWPEQPRSEADKNALIQSSLLKRMGSPEDVARTVLYLLRDASYTTGEILRVDGGRSLAI